MSISLQTYPLYFKLILFKLFKLKFQYYKKWIYKYLTALQNNEYDSMISYQNRELRFTQNVEYLQSFPKNLQHNICRM